MPSFNIFYITIMISKDLLEILCCPITKQPLFESDANTLVTADKKIAYPIRNGIPVLLAEEAITLSND
jgi:uncharacterized protein YbaR (Trm112 family)